VSSHHSDTRNQSDAPNSYVNGLNAAEEAYAAAESSGDVAKKIELQAALKFHGGGHIVRLPLRAHYPISNSFLSIAEPLLVLEEFGSLWI